MLSLLILILLRTAKIPTILHCFKRNQEKLLEKILLKTLMQLLKNITKLFIKRILNLFLESFLTPQNIYLTINLPNIQLKILLMFIH